jgi:hypothetical protein
MLLFWTFHIAYCIINALHFRSRLCFRPQVQIYLVDPLGQSTVSHWTCRRWEKSKISRVFRNIIHRRQNPAELKLSPSTPTRPNGLVRRHFGCPFQPFVIRMSLCEFANLQICEVDVTLEVSNSGYCCLVC